MWSRIVREKLELMEENITPIEIGENKKGINEANLWLNIWLKPTATMDFALRNCPTKYVTLFFILAGISDAIDRAVQKNIGDNDSLVFVLTTAIFVGAISGPIGSYIYSWALSYTGKWINGIGTASEFRTVVAWASFPVITSLILVILEIVFFGNELFKSNPSIDTYLGLYTWYFLAFLEFLLGIWGLVILVKGVMLVQGFKAGKAILNVLFPGLVILMVILVVVLIILIIR